VAREPTAAQIAEKDFPLSVARDYDGAGVEEQQGVKALQLMGTVNFAGRQRKPSSFI